MIRSSYHIIFFLLLISAMASCYSPRYVYSPAAHNIPVLTEKGGSKLAAHYSANLGEAKKITTIGKTNTGRGIDIQAAYAASNHIALQASYTQRWEKNFADYNLNRTDTSMITYSRRSAELGLGYYTLMGPRQQTVFQVFAGISLGKSDFTDHYLTSTATQDKYYNMNVTRLYVQPAFILVPDEDVFVSALSSRVSMVYFHSITTNYDAEEVKNYQLENVKGTAKIFWEPAFMNQFGIRSLPGLKLELQIGMTFLMTQRFVDYRTFNFSAGLAADLPKLFAPGKSKKAKTNKR